MTEIHGTLSELLPEIIRLSEDIYCHPELGFKEFESRRKVIQVLEKEGIPYQDAAYTGLTAVWIR